MQQVKRHTSAHPSCPESWCRCPARAVLASALLAATPAGLSGKLLGGGASEERVWSDSDCPELRGAQGHLDTFSLL